MQNVSTRFMDARPVPKMNVLDSVSEARWLTDEHSIVIDCHRTITRKRAEVTLNCHKGIIEESMSMAGWSIAVCVPEARGAVPTASCQSQPIRRERQALHKICMSAKSEQFLSG